MGILLIGNNTHRIVYLPDNPSIVFEKRGQDSLGGDLWRIERELNPEYSTPGGVIRRTVIYDFFLELYHNHIRVEDQVVIQDNRLMET